MGEWVAIRASLRDELLRDIKFRLKRTPVHHVERREELDHILDQLTEARTVRMSNTQHAASEPQGEAG